MVVVVDSPARTNLAYLFGVLFGISYGWYYPASNGYYVALVPEEKVSELWGLNSLCSVILSWVPPLIFAVLNETTGKIQVGWVGVILFELIGLIISFTIPEETKSNDDDIVLGKEVNRRDSFMAVSNTTLLVDPSIIPASFSEEAFKKFEQEISVIEKGHDDE
jgi:MFS family permease